MVFLNCGLCVFPNPNGIPSSSPGLPGTGYPGLLPKRIINPERVESRPRANRRALPDPKLASVLPQPQPSSFCFASTFPPVSRRPESPAHGRASAANAGGVSVMAGIPARRPGRGGFAARLRDGAAKGACGVAPFPDDGLRIGHGLLIAGAIDEEG